MIGVGSPTRFRSARFLDTPERREEGGRSASVIIRVLESEAIVSTLASKSKSDEE